MKWKTISSLPKINSAKLHDENRVYIHPACDLGKGRFLPDKGWKIIGWGTPPFKGCGPHAIIYERVGNINKTYYSTFDFGIYWGHGNARKMKFKEELRELSREELEEFDGWLTNY